MQPPHKRWMFQIGNEYLVRGGRQITIGMHDIPAAVCRQNSIDATVFFVRRSLSYALPLPVVKPCGVGLCWMIKLYQSMTQTAPSGPTSAIVGDAHSSSLASRLVGLVDL